MPKPNKEKLYTLVINALTEGDSFIVPIDYNWVEKSYIGGYVELTLVQGSYFNLEIYNQYGAEKYEIHKYKGTVPVSDKQSCNS